MLTLPGNVNVKPIVDRAIGELRMALGSGPGEVAPSTLEFRFEEVDPGTVVMPRFVVQGSAEDPAGKTAQEPDAPLPLQGRGPDTDHLRRRVVEQAYGDDPSGQSFLEFVTLLNRFEQSARNDAYRFWRHQSKRTAPIPEGHVVGDGGDCGCYPISRSSDWHLCVDPESPTYVFGVWGMRPSKARSDQEEQS
jgi:hypothetical protein